MPVLVGLQSRFRDTDATAALEYSATDLTPLGASTVESGSSNLCTNPEAETDTSGWTNNSLTTFERVTSLPSTTGLPAGVTTGFHAVGNSDNDHARDDIAVTSGRTYRFSAYVYLDTNTATGLKLEVRSAAGVTKAVSAADFSTLDAWSRLDVSVLADATETWTWRIRQTGAGATDFYFTAVEVEEATSLTPYGDAIRNTNLTPTWTAVLKSELDATNAALTHVGSFRVWARIFRPTTNTGELSVRLEWAKGDYRTPTLNDPIVFAGGDHEGRWLLVDLGVVHPDSSRWEFRALAKSSVVGDEIDFQWFGLFPTGPERSYIELSARQAFEAPSSFLARDEFGQTAGNLNGKVLPVGGSWATSLDGGADFVVETTGKTVQRSALDDLRVFAIAGSTNYGATLVGIDFKHTDSNAVADDQHDMGVVARHTSDTNYLSAELKEFRTLVVNKTLVGINTRLAGANLGSVAADVFWSLRMAAFASGHVFVWLYRRGSAPGRPVLATSHPDLASGTLASGTPGFLEEIGSSENAHTRTYDNFFVAPPTPDAAIFAGQSLELRHDGADREDSTGTFSSPVSIRRGKYLTIPAAQLEGRASRMIVRAAVGPVVAPGVILDDTPPALEATLFATSRYLSVPEP